MHTVQTELHGAQLLTLTDRLDAEAAPELEQRCERLIGRQTRTLIVNLSTLDYLSSAGLCALLNLAKLAKARQSRLILCGPTPAVRQILNLSGFDKILPISEELSEALTL